MNLYLLSQTEASGYDTFSAMVVVAPSEEIARNIHPRNYPEAWEDTFSEWASSPANVIVALIGKAKSNIPSGIILASFHAG